MQISLLGTLLADLRVLFRLLLKSRCEELGLSGIQKIRIGSPVWCRLQVGEMKVFEIVKRITR